MAAPTTPQEFIAFVRNVQAVRHFRTEPIPDQALADILDVARWTGSAKNVQPWEFIVIHNRATLTALADLDGFVKHLWATQMRQPTVPAQNQHKLASL